jgi:hypothetical protein
MVEYLEKEVESFMKGPPTHTSFLDGVLSDEPSSDAPSRNFMEYLTSPTHRNHSDLFSLTSVRRDKIKPGTNVLQYIRETLLEFILKTFGIKIDLSEFEKIYILFPNIRLLKILSKLLKCCIYNEKTEFIYVPSDPFCEKTLQYISESDKNSEKKKLVIPNILNKQKYKKYLKYLKQELILKLSDDVKQILFSIKHCVPDLEIDNSGLTIDLTLLESQKSDMDKAYEKYKLSQGTGSRVAKKLRLSDDDEEIQIKCKEVKFSELEEMVVYDSPYNLVSETIKMPNGMRIENCGAGSGKTAGFSETKYLTVLTKIPKPKQPIFKLLSKKMAKEYEGRIKKEPFWAKTRFTSDKISIYLQLNSANSCIKEIICEKGVITVIFITNTTNIAELPQWMDKKPEPFKNYTSFLLHEINIKKAYTASFKYQFIYQFTNDDLIIDENNIITISIQPFLLENYKCHQIIA